MKASELKSTSSSFSSSLSSSFSSLSSSPSPSFVMLSTETSAVVEDAELSGETFSERGTEDVLGSSESGPLAFSLGSEPNWSEELSSEII